MIKNDAIWKYQILRVLKFTKLSNITLGTEKRPLTDINNLQDAWDEKDAKAAHILSSTMKEDQMINYITSESANELWTTLCSIHEERSENNKLSLY